MAASSRPSPLVLVIASTFTIALAFLAGRLSVSRLELDPDPAPASREPEPATASESAAAARSAHRRQPAPDPAPAPLEPSIVGPVAVAATGDLGVDALNRLVERLQDTQAMEPRLAGHLQPTLEQALADHGYNPRAVTLSPEERTRFLEWIDGFDAVVKRLVLESEEFTYREALRRLAAGNERWIQADLAKDVAAALRDEVGTNFVVQTDFASREAVATHLTARFSKPGVSIKTLSTGGSRAGTARFTVFVAGDGSQVIETAKALDEAQKFRQQAIRDYLMHLPR